jgi:predicted lipid-binding transport protein (Tim44 family)
MYHWIVFLHVLGAFAFVTAHGGSANVAFKLRHETSRERIAALLDLSTAFMSGMLLALLVMLLSGIGLGFLGSWWGQGWIWLALALLLAKLFAMFTMAARSFTQLRQAAGLPYFDGKPHPAAPPASPEEIAARAAAINPVPIAVVGFGGLALIVWLMMFKPF